jgi:copper chaperone NosL
MFIWINQLGGDEPGTLQNINILNHYVGMKMIEPESIPELKYFPKVIIAMAVLGIIFGFVNNRKLWIAWGIVLITLGGLGIYDFYLWEYDYGHNLAEDAPIKVPGQAYQPPLFGSKMLLNFNAKSYPYFGAIFIGISLVCSFLSFYLAMRQSRESKQVEFSKKVSYVTLLFSVWFLWSCNPGSQPIQYGKDKCEFCRMSIVDQRFGGEIVTLKGKVYKFDAVECMVNYIDERVEDESTLKFILTNTYDAPGQLIAANECNFLKSENMPSPMGMFINPFQGEEAAVSSRRDNSGMIMSWDELRAEFAGYRSHR